MYIVVNRIIAKIQINNRITIFINEGLRIVITRKPARVTIIFIL